MGESDSASRLNTTSSGKFTSWDEETTRMGDAIFVSEGAPPATPVLMMDIAAMMLRRVILSVRCDLDRFRYR